MSEAAAPEKPKKKGKLPMILALVVMLVAGGFFGMKMGSGGKKEEPPIELGEVVPLGEFLVNLNDGRTFLKTDIAVHVAKNMHLTEEAGGGHEGKAEPPAPVRDAVISVLTRQDFNEIATPEGKEKLKKEIAKAINAVVPHHDEEKDKKGKGKKAKGHAAKSEGEAGAEKGAEGHGASHEEEIVDETWDSQTGPVLKVYFTTFATQQ
ncbi:MAG: flagellar basal body-associated FliL family protein [Armatimonadetes bacterium]|nr:flagellar basal body-associated FliL family protein [Armatimonadota bacterium]